MSPATTISPRNSLRAIAESLRSDARFLGFLLSLAPRACVIIVAGTFALVAANLLGVLLVQPVLDSIGPARDSGSMSSLLTAICALVGAFIVAPTVQSGTRVVVGHVSNRMVVAMHERFATAALSGKTADFWLADPNLSTAGRDTSERLRNWMLPEGLEASWDVAVMRLSAIPMLVVVGTWNWGIAVALAVSLVFASILHGRLMEVTLRAARDDRREADIATYFYKFAMERRTAKEVRIFHMGDWLADRMNAWGLCALAGNERNFTSASRRALASSMVCLAVHVVALAVLGAHLLTDPTDGPRIVVLILAIVALNGLGPAGDRGVIAAAGKVTNESLVRFERLVEGASELQLRELDQIGPGLAISLSDVTFGYGDDQPPVLDGLDLVVQRGERIGVVGVNGAGKSTLAGIVAGVLTPVTGAVTVVGPDGEVPAVAWVTQDFLKYPESVKDNIWLGHPGQAEALGSFSQVMESPYDYSQSNGIVRAPGLSGGQWQRVALARGVAAASRGAEVVILDEPTAALDAEAEAEFFDALVDSLPERTIILISHRLSSVRRADTIYVLDGGVVSESGTHKELVARRGIYFRMFSAQARRYDES